MAGPSLVVAAQINLRMTGKGAEQAKKALKGVDKAAGKTTKSLTALGAKMSAVLGGALLARFARESLGVFAKWERQLFAITQQMERLGISTQDALPQVTKFLEELESSAGILRQDAAVEFQRFLGIVEDVDAAMLLTRTAAGAANQGLGEFGNAAKALSSILLGEVIEPAKSLAIATDASRDSIEQQNEVIQEAITRYAPFADTIADTTGKIDSFGAVWNEVKVQVGSLFGELTKLIGGTETITKVIRSAGPAINLFGLSIAGFFTGIAKSIAAVFNVKRLIKEGFTGFARAIEEEFIAGFDSVLASADESRKKLEQIWAEGGEEAEKERAEAEAEARRKADEAIAKLTEAKADEAAKKRRNKEKARLEKEAEERIAFNEKIQDEILRAQIDATEEGTDERLELEIQMLQRLRAKALEEAKKRNADEAAVNSLFDMMEAERRAEFDEEQEEAARERREEAFERHLELERDLYEAELALLEETDEKRYEMQLEQLERERQAAVWNAILTGEEIEKVQELFAARKKKIEKDAADAAVQFAEWEAKTKQERAAETAQAVLDAAFSIFGENKALAIAQVVLDTLNAGMRVHATIPYPWSIPFYAAVTASGLAALKRIQSTELGSASIGGVSGGGGAAIPVSPTAPVASAVPPPPTTAADGAQTGTQVVHNYNPSGPNIIDRATMRRFAREIDRARRDDRRTRIVGAS